MIQKHAESEHIADVSVDVLEAKLRALFPAAVTEGKITDDYFSTGSSMVVSPSTQPIRLPPAAFAGCSLP